MDPDMAFEATVMIILFFLMPMKPPEGTNHGPRPKPLILVALGGCTGMDVISILKKMKVEPDYFNVQVEGELTEEHPKVYHTITITYIFRGKDLEMENLKKLLNLSQEKYCGVSAMIGKAAKLKYKMLLIVEPKLCIRQASPASV